MKITIIYGQNHKGSTYNIARMLADKVIANCEKSEKNENNNSITEFFLPRDFDKFCLGCTNCFIKDEKLCTHAETLQPITNAMDEADLIILASPVYVYHATGAMKAFLDHYGWRHDDAFHAVVVARAQSPRHDIEQYNTQQRQH